MLVVSCIVVLALVHSCRAMFNFDSIRPVFVEKAECFAAVKRLAGKIVFEMSYSVMTGTLYNSYCCCFSFD